MIQVCSIDPMANAVNSNLGMESPSKGASFYLCSDDRDIVGFLDGFWIQFQTLGNHVADSAETIHSCVDDGDNRGESLSFLVAKRG